MTHPLDNPAWTALSTGNRNLAQGTEEIKYYQPDISPFAGLAETTKENLETLYDITPDQSFAVVTTQEMIIPAPWKTVHCAPVYQMLFEKPMPHKASTAQLIALTNEHIPQMLALTKLTNPGPFRDRTIDYGHYQGIFDGTRLVAMAGQRMHAVPYAEISAVCTHPDYAGRGYAAQLMLSQIDRINKAGETPFLHVATKNQRAIKIYESLGFKTRKELFVYFIEKARS